MNVYAMKKQRKINSVSVSMALILFLMGYLAYAIVPVWFPMFRMSGVMRGVCNEAYKNFDDEELTKKVLTGARIAGLRLTREEVRFVRVPYDPEVLAMEAPNWREVLSKRGARCQVVFETVAQIHFPIIEKVVDWPYTGYVDREIPRVVKF